MKNNSNLVHKVEASATWLCFHFVLNTRTIQKDKSVILAQRYFPVENLNAQYFKFCLCITQTISSEMADLESGNIKMEDLTSENVENVKAYK